MSLRFKYFTKKSILPYFLIIACWQKKGLNMRRWGKMLMGLNIKSRTLPLTRNKSTELNKCAVCGSLAHSAA